MDEPVWVVKFSVAVLYGLVGGIVLLMIVVGIGILREWLRERRGKRDSTGY